MKKLKERIKSGETVHGSWVNLGSHVSAEIMGSAGFDWLLVDMEHGSGNEGMLFHQLQALASSPVTPLVRTNEASRAKVQLILDWGSQGIMFPQIQNPTEAESATKLMYYPPKGIRGMAKVTRATRFGKKSKEYLDEIEQTLIGIIQIETLPALKQVDAIASLNTVDVLFVGPTDLSVALGTLNQIQHPEFQKALKIVSESAHKHGKAAGVLMHDLNEYPMYADLGYKFLACGGDAFFVMKGADAMAGGMKALLK